MLSLPTFVSRCGIRADSCIPLYLEVPGGAGGCAGALGRLCPALGVGGGMKGKCHSAALSLARR